MTDYLKKWQKIKKKPNIIIFEGGAGATPKNEELSIPINILKQKIKIIFGKK